jgi:NAD-dependent deacetylase
VNALDGLARVRRALDGARRAVVLTGAGISVAAGLPTYRGEGGLWERRPDLAQALRAGAAPALLWDAMLPMREVARGASPTAAHRALAVLGIGMAARGATLTVITQNVDGLHACAGQPALIELHGRLERTRCTGCDVAPFVDARDDPRAPCVACGAAMRPDIVLFDEPLGAREEVDAKRAFRDIDVFVSIGTSGKVDPAARFVRWARFEGALTACIDRAPPAASAAGFELSIAGDAQALVPELITRAV